MKKKILAILSKKSTGNILAVSVIVIFLILGLIRLYPYDNTLEIILNTTGDDWQGYALGGMDIRHNGLLMPMIDGVYKAPAGFLFHYFVALCLLLFGDNIIPVYLMQHLMIGFAAALMYWTFRDKMRPLTGILFLGGLFLFSRMDVYKWYAVRLLSENLIFFTIPLFFFCFIRGFEKNNTRLQLFSAFIMGITVLARSNALPVALAMMFIVFPYYIKRRPKGIFYLLLFILIMASTASLLGLRNYLVCGEWVFLPVQKVLMHMVHPIPETVDLSRVAAKGVFANYFEFMRQEPAVFFTHYVKKILFCFGFLPVLDSNFKWRPHWMFMWVGYFIYLFFHIKDRRKFEMWEVAVHLYLIFYYGPLIIAVQLQNYGFRYLIPAINFVLIFFFLAWDRLLGPLYKKLEE